MNTLAETDVTTWAAPLLTSGVMGAILAFIGYMIYRYLPPVVEAHLSFVKSTQHNLEKLSDTTAEHGKTCQQTLAKCERIESAVSGLTCLHRGTGEP